jgi:hypothetical protein
MCSSARSEGGAGLYTSLEASFSGQGRALRAREEAGEKRISIINPRISWRMVTYPAAQASWRHAYKATYYDEQGHAIVSGQEVTAGSALAELYLNLHNRGYSISKLPEPIRE